ncbi:MAG: right-handed parallel beta-helix repeat-containing protein [Nannocystis sp.]|nr:parallel beta-helix domain-containing protein [Nannocystis sp.]MBA3546699.1 right-handed parallel beta-helix repeat-containing protein [Nannocystis sp.]
MTYDGVSHHDGKAWSSEKKATIGAGEDLLQGIAVDAAGKVWVASTHKVHLRDGGAWQTIDLGKAGRGTLYFDDLELGPDGSVYALHSTALLRIGPQVGSTDSTGSTPTTGPDLSPECDVMLHGESDDADAVQAALTGAGEGATICFTGEFMAPGAGFSVASTRGLTLRGVPLAGSEGIGAGALFDFAAEGSAPGLLLTDAEDLTIEGLTLRSSGGDGLTIFGGARVKLRDLRVSWAAGASEDNGAFGMHVRDVVDLQIADSEVSDAADAGIYAAGSRNVVFKSNLAHGNVAGLEAENCENVEISDNEASDNTVGIFVLDLPMQAAGNGGGVLVQGNRILDNNHANFAPAGKISASVPVGIGALVLAVDEVELQGNLIENNDSTGVLVVSFTTLSLVSGMSYNDPNFDPDPETVEIDDNQLLANGDAPDDLFVSLFQQPMMPDITWDGAFDSLKKDKDNADGALSLCIRGNGDADFLNLDAANFGANKSTDLAPHDCDHPARPAVDNGL